MAQKWTTMVAQELKDVDFGDERLAERCQKVAKDIASHPDQSIPQACGDWGRTKGAYRFFDNENVSRKALLEPHESCTLERCQGMSEVLVIQDTTYLNYTTHPATEGLGPIGTARHLRGLVVHSALAVSLQGETLGLVDQQVWARQGRKPPRETTIERQKRDRESQCWARGLEAVRKKGLKNAIHVADRESDVYEFLERLVHHQEHFVLRARHDRSLIGSKESLFQALRGGLGLGQMRVELPPRTGQPQRQAHLTVRQVQVTVGPTLGHQGPSLKLQVVEAYEEHPPKGCDALRWVLLTQEPTDTLEACVRVITFYTRRWIIEEFHKGLKTGCHVEERELETRERLEVFLGLASVISVMLLRLRDAARTEGPALDFLNPVQLSLLRSKYPNLSRKPSARQALRTVAQLGGFLARKGDGEPGWRTLWRGMYDLLLMEHAYLFAKSQLLSRRTLPTCG